MGLWGYGAVRQFGSTAVRQFGSTAVRQCGCTAVRQYGFTAMRLCGYADATSDGNPIHSPVTRVGGQALRSSGPQAPGRAGDLVSGIWHLASGIRSGGWAETSNLQLSTFNPQQRWWAEAHPTAWAGGRKPSTFNFQPLTRNRAGGGPQGRIAAPPHSRRARVGGNPQSSIRNPQLRPGGWAAFRFPLSAFYSTILSPTHHGLDQARVPSSWVTRT